MSMIRSEQHPRSSVIASYLSGPTRCAACREALRRGRDAGALLDLDDNELRRLERREANNHVHDTVVHVVLGHRLPAALHEVGIARGCARECSLATQTLHELVDV